MKAVDTIGLAGVGMQNYKGLILPAHETHLITWMEKIGEVLGGKPVYQGAKLRAALKHVKDFGLAVDVGAHCGLHSMHLVKRFGYVRAFEPVALHRKCFEMNVPCSPLRLPPDNCVLFPYALGDKEGRVSIHTSNGSSGDSWVDGDGDIPLCVYDNTFGEASPRVGFVKLDCEGYEYFALKGMEKMLVRDRPTVLVEQKPGRADKFGLKTTQACTYLESMGFKRQWEKSGDYCYTG